jgi:hypothetical protein
MMFYMYVIVLRIFLNDIYIYIMNYFDNMIQTIKHNMSTLSLITNIINPLSPYILCDHFIGTEINSNISPIIIENKNNLLNLNNISKVKKYDIVQCQINYFDYFIKEILPKLTVKIVLITSQQQLPQINRSIITDNLLKNEKILLWISQNPIYQNESKYIPFPYGVRECNLYMYFHHLLKNCNKIEKNINVNHLHCNVLTNKCRKKLPKRGKTRLNKYYTNVAMSKYLLSPIGDRDDCYRHYECIGLGTIPISNISPQYIPIFEDSIYVTDIDNMINILKRNTINDHIYKMPNKNIVTFEYHRDKIKQIIKNKIDLLI